MESLKCIHLLTGILANGHAFFNTHSNLFDSIRENQFGINESLYNSASLQCTACIRCQMTRDYHGCLLFQLFTHCQFPSINCLE